jgi:uncharacterized membrane protein YkvA (DUF1232 family)
VLSLLWRPRLLKTLLTHARLAFRLVREPRVPLLVKAMPFLAIVYVISPLDFIPDVLPVLGEIDDLVIVLTALQVFLRLCPADAVQFHSGAIAQSRRYTPMAATDTIIDAEWRHGS